MDADSEAKKAQEALDAVEAALGTKDADKILLPLQASPDTEMGWLRAKDVRPGVAVLAALTRLSDAQRNALLLGARLGPTQRALLLSLQEHDLV